ncbi:MAG TPA: cupin domain-containing protein [Terriglobales bacterium]|nr:cupin domain-containing protein [Terriglobales bacterium]
MPIERWNPERDGPLSEAALRHKLEKLGYVVAGYVYPPGTCFPTHTHTVDKMDAVVSGCFRITMGKESVVLEAGDAMAVPRGAAHSAQVVGDEPVVSLDGVKA